METEEYTISDIQESLFFIQNKEHREKISTLCLFATSVNCTTLSETKERIEEIGDSSIIEYVKDGTIELIMTKIFSKKLWSEVFE